MADMKPATLRGSTTVAQSRAMPRARAEPYAPVLPRSVVQEQVEPNEVAPKRAADVPSFVSDFSAPSARTTAWLADPRLVATLEAASQALAPAGSAKDATDQYAASVIETHLVARRRLSKLTNALLKT